jgi:hypothetical protein
LPRDDARHAVLGRRKRSGRRRHCGPRHQRLVLRRLPREPHQAPGGRLLPRLRGLVPRQQRLAAAGGVQPRLDVRSRLGRVREAAGGLVPAHPDRAVRRLRALSLVLSDPAGYVAALGAFTAGVGFAVDEIWTDFEVKDIGAGGAAGANKMHTLSHRRSARPSATSAASRATIPISLKTARRSSPGRRASSCRPRTSTGRRRCPPGWFGGFGALLQQEIVDIGGASNIGALSPAICPACPTGSDADDTLTQEQLFVRMDLMRAQGITDESGFTFFEIAQGPQGNAALGERYFEAFSYA